MPTLEALNAYAATMHTTETVTLRFAVGRTGGHSALGATGSKMHVLRLHQMRRGASVTAPCNGARPTTGTEAPGVGLEAVTCKKCLAWVERVLAE